MMTNSKLTLKNRKEIDQRFIDDLYLFYRYFVARIKFGSNAKPAKHIKKLSRKLMALSNGKLDKHLAVSMPPRHSKSSMITVAYPLWLIFQNPELNILVITNTGELAEKFGIDIREFIDRYGAMFNVYLSPVKHSSTHIKLCDKFGNLYNGSIRLIGAGGSITGQDADYLIIDDPYKGEEDEFTPTALDKKINWFLRLIEQRLEPHTKLLVLHTRWHSRDLIGYFKEDEEFKQDFQFITFPAILPNGKPLWPEQYSIEVLEKKRRKVKERLFNAIWQQKPLDDTADFFDIDKLRYESYRPGEYPVMTVRSWDIASSDSLTADFTVGTKMVLTNFNRIGVTDIVRGQYGDETKQKIFDTAQSDGYNVLILIETGIAAAGELLFEEWEYQLDGYRVYRSQAITSKADRATPLKNGVIDEDFFIDINDNKLIDAVNKELKAFPEGVHDDIPDSMAYGYIYLHMCIEDTDESYGLVA